MIIASMPIAGHHREVLAVRSVDRDLDQVDGPGPTGQGDLDRLGLVLRDAEVAGEQVGRARRHDAHRDAAAGQAVGHDAYGAVAAGGDHQIDVSATARGGHRPAGVVLGGLQPQRLGPAASRPAGSVMASRKPSDTLIGLAIDRAATCAARSFMILSCRPPVVVRVTPPDPSVDAGPQRIDFRLAAGDQ